MWALDAKKVIIPVVSRDDKGRIGDFIKEAQARTERRMQITTNP